MMSSLFDFSWILLFQTFFRKVSWVSDFCDNYPWNFLLTCSFSYFQENINEIDQQIKAKESEINTLKDEAASLKTEQQEIVLELQERKKAVKDKQVDIVFVHCAITRSIGIPLSSVNEIIEIYILFLSESCRTGIFYQGPWDARMAMAGKMSLKKWIHHFSIFMRIFPTGVVK